MNTEKLDPEFKEKWLVDLRSGEYKQHRGGFTNADRSTFCCLAVAALLCGVKRYDFFGPCSDAGWANYDKISLRLRDYDLVRMNDHEEKSFAEIADYIEKNL